MRVFFEVITTTNRWLRQQYDSIGDRTSRVFWNQIMVVLGIIMLIQEGIAVTVGNLERYTPIPKTSIYRTLKLLESEGILSQTGEQYGFACSVPQDILELSTNRTPVELNGLIDEIKSMMKSELKEVLQTLPLQQDQIEQVTKRIDNIRPKKKKLDMRSTLVGDGFM